MAGSLGFVFCAPPLFAHDSIALCTNETVDLDGEFSDVRWQNPHINFVLKTVGADGSETLWQLESSSIFLREQDGVTRDLFRVGD